MLLSVGIMRTGRKKEKEGKDRWGGKRAVDIIISVSYVMGQGMVW